MGTALTKWQSDGYENRQCALCGHRIGYGRFWATNAPLNANTAPYAGESENLIHGEAGDFRACPRM